MKQRTEQIVRYLQEKKSYFREQLGIINVGIYGSYARDEAEDNSDIDIFYESDSRFSMGFVEFSNFVQNLEKDLGLHVDFVDLAYMNPIVKHYAKKDFIYV